MGVSMLCPSVWTVMFLFVAADATASKAYLNLTGERQSNRTYQKIDYIHEKTNVLEPLSKIRLWRV